MENSLDMSLDDLIKNRSNSERGRGRGRARQGRERERGGTFSRGRAFGMLHRGPLRVNARPSANVISKFNHPSSRTNGVPWQHDLFEDSLVAAGYSGSETGTKLYVSNLDLGVTNEDIKELFSEIGELKRYAVHYDRNGRSCGSAEVVFTKRTEALAAMKRYNNVQLDGKAMKIEIIGTGLGLPVSARVNVIGGSNGRGRRTVVMIFRSVAGGSRKFFSTDAWFFEFPELRTTAQACITAHAATSSPWIIGSAGTNHFIGGERVEQEVLHCSVVVLGGGIVEVSNVAVGLVRVGAAAVAVAVVVVVVVAVAVAVAVTV